MCWNPGFATATQAAELALHWNFLGRELSQQHPTRLHAIQEKL
jgi:hypothetical protein